MRLAACTIALTLVVAFSNSVEAAVLEFLPTSRGNVSVWVPDDYTPDEPLPLVMALHGYTQTAAEIEAYFDFRLQVDERRFIYVIPQGTTNFLGQTYWNATDACCDLLGSSVDDSGFLRGLIELAQSTYSIDPNRIHIAGLSNGGFMAHRMAIDHADIIASVVSLAGANFKDALDYQPTDPVHTLQIHGTLDDTILYNGGSILGIPYPGAIETQFNWAFYNQLDATIDDVGVPFNMDFAVAGDETTSLVFDLDNEPGIKVELWTMAGSGHVPNIGNGSSNLFAQNVLDWLYDHPKPRMDVVSPEAANLAQGRTVGGGLVDLLSSDNQDWIVRRAGNNIQPKTMVDISTTSPTDSPHSIRIRLECSVLSRPQITQTIQLFNFDTQLWETVDAQSASQFSDLVVEVRPTGDVTRFVDATTLEMRARIIHLAPVNRARFSASLDEVAWIVFY
ncbi:MAG: hypothetical protein GY768_32560 [Planctomycetaceae bacterium]|nr:hypothetical protein [Planctomycetaceae bacterium]